MAQSSGQEQNSPSASLAETSSLHPSVPLAADKSEFIAAHLRSWLVSCMNDRLSDILENQEVAWTKKKQETEVDHENEIKQINQWFNEKIDEICKRKDQEMEEARQQRDQELNAANQKLERIISHQKYEWDKLIGRSQSLKASVEEDIHDGVSVLESRFESQWARIFNCLQGQYIDDAFRSEINSSLDLGASIHAKHNERTPVSDIPGDLSSTGAGTGSTPQRNNREASQSRRIPMGTGATYTPGIPVNPSMINQPNTGVREHQQLFTPVPLESPLRGSQTASLLHGSGEPPCETNRELGNLAHGPAMPSAQQDISKSGEMATGIEYIVIDDDGYQMRRLLSPEKKRPSQDEAEPVYLSQKKRRIITPTERANEMRWLPGIIPLSPTSSLREREPGSYVCDRMFNRRGVWKDPTSGVEYFIQCPKCEKMEFRCIKGFKTHYSRVHGQFKIDDPSLGGILKAYGRQIDIFMQDNPTLFERQPRILSNRDGRNKRAATRKFIGSIDDDDGILHYQDESDGGIDVDESITLISDPPASPYRGSCSGVAPTFSPISPGSCALAYGCPSTALASAIPLRQEDQEQGKDSSACPPSDQHNPLSADQSTSTHNARPTDIWSPGPTPPPAALRARRSESYGGTYHPLFGSGESASNGPASPDSWWSLTRTDVNSEMISALTQRWISPSSPLSRPSKLVTLKYRKGIDRAGVASEGVSEPGMEK